jgi:hypothetical protein
MKRIATLLLAGALTAGLTASASAQPEKYDFGVFADPAGTQTTTAVSAFVTFDFYAVGFQLDGLVKGFELTLNMPPGFTVLTRTIAGPNPINVGDESSNEFIIGTGACVDGGTGAFTLVTINAGYFATPVPSDAAVCISGTTPSSFPNGEPGYLQCDNTLIAAGVASTGDPNYPDGCLILNPTSEPPVSTESASFGALKTRF